MTAPDTARAFAAAEGAYLEPPFNPRWVCFDECPQCSASSECDECEVCAELNADAEPDYEREAEEREEMREERWSRD